MIVKNKPKHTSGDYAKRVYTYLKKNIAMRNVAHIFKEKKC